MHSYHHNIKTFNSDTRNLTRVERSLYRDLIELYYDTEKPIPADNFYRLCRKVMANTEEEKEALQYVLDEYFILTGDVYTHNYCDEQIDKYYANSTAKALAGKASAEARRIKSEQRKIERAQQKLTSVEHPLNSVEQNPTNHKPLTINHKPLLKDVTPSAPSATPKKKTKSGSRLPDDWRPTQEHVDAAMMLNPDYSREWFSATAHKFRDYWVAKTGKDATKADWLATWRNWVRNDLEFNRGKNNAKPQKLDDNNTDWVDLAFGSTASGDSGEQNLQWLEGDFSSVGGSDQRSGLPEPSEGGMAERLDREPDNN